MAKNISLNFFFKFSYGGLISGGLSFISTPIITSLVLPDQFGKASMMVLSFSLLINILLLGSDQSFVRFFYQEKYCNNKGLLLVNSIITPFILTILTIVLIIIMGSKISYLLIGKISDEVPILLSLLLFCGIIERFSNLLIRMEQKAVLFSNLKIIQSLINIFVVVFYAKFIESSFTAIIYGSLVSTAIVGIIGVFVERKQWSNYGVNLNKIDIFEILRYGLPFIPTFLISWIFEGIDKIALKNYSNFNEIGLYTAAYKIVAILSIVQITFSNYWVPISYEAYEKKTIESKILFQNVFKALSGVFFVIAILIISLKEIIINMFAYDYRSASIMVPFLVFMPIMYTLSEITVGGINFKKKTYWHFIIALISAIINFVGVYFLVPKYGGVGASISTGITYIFFFYLRTIISNYYYPMDFEIIKTSKATFLILFISFVNTFSSNKMIILTVNFTALLTIIFLYKHEFSFLIKKIINKPKT